MRDKRLTLPSKNTARKEDAWKAVLMGDIDHELQILGESLALELVETKLLFRSTLHSFERLFKVGHPLTSICPS